MALRTPVPDAVKVAVREAAAFGCANCGAPFGQYHHIDGWKATGHDPKRMLFLCPHCRQFAAEGSLDVDEMNRLRLAPCNADAGMPEGHLYTAAETIVVHVGSTFFIGEGPKLIYEDETLLDLRLGPHGDIRVSMVLHDDRGEVVLQICENEWVKGSAAEWAVESGAQSFRIRERSGDLSLSLDARNAWIAVEGAFQRNGEWIHLSSKAVETPWRRHTDRGGIAVCNGGIRWFRGGAFSLFHQVGAKRMSLVPIGSGPLQEELTKAMRAAKAEEASLDWAE